MVKRKRAVTTTTLFLIMKMGTKGLPIVLFLGVRKDGQELKEERSHR